MFKRILAALLALTMILLCVGCGKEKSDSTIPDNKKIAIFIQERVDNPEIYDVAAQLADLCGENLLVVGLGEGYEKDTNALSESALALAERDDIAAMIFAAGVEGVCRAARMVREKRDDMIIVSCCPEEGNELLANYADLTLNLDFTALADSMVAKAKEMGAENFVFYTTNTALKVPAMKEFRMDVELACKDNKLTYKAAQCADMASKGMTEDLAKQYIREDVPRKIEALGKKTAVFCTDPLVQGTLAETAIKYDIPMVSTFFPSPIHIAQALGVDMTENPIGDVDCMKQLQETAKDTGAAGHIATWSSSAAKVILGTAFSYVGAIIEDGAGTVTNETKLTEMARVYSASETTKFAPLYDGIFLLQDELVTL